jgi:MoaA/NifB/PqqE/SkfB family radical SAM enzyme
MTTTAEAAATETPTDLFAASLQSRSLTLRGMPTELTIELTSRCQLACVICPRETLYKELVHNREMAWDLYERVARSCVPHLRYLGLAGGLGEPLLYSRFADAVQLARSLNPDMWMSVTTNALLPRTLRTLTPLAPLFTVITLSMDAIGEHFDRIVGQANAFPAFERAARELIAMMAPERGSLWFNSVATPETVDTLHQVVQTIADWGGTYLYINGMNHAATGKGSGEYAFFLTPAYRKRMAELVDLGASIGVTVEWADMATLKGFSSCKAPWDNFYIGWDGRLPGCCAKPFPELLNFGHVDDGGLGARINDPGLVEWRRLSILNESPAFCEGCAVQHKPPAIGSDGSR